MSVSSPMKVSVVGALRAGISMHTINTLQYFFKLIVNRHSPTPTYTGLSSPLAVVVSLLSLSPPLDKIAFRRAAAFSAAVDIFF